MEKPASKEEAARLLWQHAPQLLFETNLLDATQREIHQAFVGTEARTFVLNCSRRLGKSYWLCCEAIIAALSTRGTQVRYAAQTARQVKTIIFPLMRKILEQCPEKVKPTWHAQDGVFNFKNDSQVFIVGCDSQNAERLRGNDTHLAIVDEAGQIDDLEYIVGSILMPQVLSAGGKVILASTPPRSTGHPFVKKYCHDALKEGRGAYVCKTIFDCPRYTPAQIEEFKREVGGDQSTAWRREYLVEFVSDANFAIIPEFTKSVVVEEWPRPPFYYAYTSMDPGFTHATACLFAYYDFREGKLVIEDGFAMRRATTKQVAEEIRKRELALWGTEPKNILRKPPPFLRVSDVEPRMLADLATEHKLTFSQVMKDDKEAAVNALRLAIQNGKIVINKRCEALIADLQHGVWNQKRTDFAEDSDGAHYDSIDALIYLVRSVAHNLNPYPQYDAGVTRHTHYIPSGRRRSGLSDAAVSLGNIFRRRT